ncbi:MAG: MFS transporter [Bacillota bacterium]
MPGATEPETAPPDGRPSRPRFSQSALGVFSLGRNLGLVALSALFFNLGQSLQRGIYPNYLKDLGIPGDQLGAIESLRELPGLATGFLAVFAFVLPESVLAAVCLLAVALGFVFYGLANGFVMLLVATLVMSTGFHLFFPAQSSMILRYSKKGEKATALGVLNSVTALASVVAMFSVAALTRVVSFRTIYYLAAGLAVISAVVIIRLPRERGAARERRLNLNPRFSVYYWLTFFSGGRRHIFMTFAQFALASVYGLSADRISVAIGTVSIVSFFTRPMMGRVIDRYGERRVLLFNYVTLVGLYLGYAFIHYLPLVYVIFGLDQLFMDFDMAQTTYLDKLATRDEIPATLSTGSTINHISGVGFPLLGGVIWKVMGPGATFVFGAALAAASAVASHFVHPERTPAKVAA